MLLFAMDYRAYCPGSQTEVTGTKNLLLTANLNSINTERKTKLGLTILYPASSVRVVNEKERERRAPKA